ncbi:hypothetical protein B0T17DRAFT_504177 [Bombardia bombarda]|uniref:Protein HRI1 n=1 Tax=Bombardia bombarda TaxID=252184 RepID=A0AA39XMH2_9PEZI|nr:hypothetical protein B0T17DRAFT_504177 [Bombardia bombarda]
MCDISVREHIRWLPDAASEPTSTIVLTSPERRFVDLRILLAGDEPTSAGEEGGNLPLSRLDWAIAGTSSSTPRRSEDNPPVEYSHAEWHHWINSRTADTANGRMVNPTTGIETDYEELWRSEPIGSVPVSVPVPGAAGATCVVLKMHDDDSRKRGMLVRLGQYCQAVVRRGDLITVERWKWTAADSTGGGWTRQVKIGDGELPTDFATEFGHEAEVGDEVKVGADIWEVVEKS